VRGARLVSWGKDLLGRRLAMRLALPIFSHPPSEEEIIHFIGVAPLRGMGNSLEDLSYHSITLTMARYIIYGAGAIGSILGAGLYHTGQDVVLVGRGRHVEAIRRHGLQTEGRGTTSSN